MQTDLGRFDTPKSGIWDVLGQLLLLGKGKETITLDPQHQCGLLDHLQRFGNTLRAPPADIVCVELPRHGDVAVAIEPLDKLLALVAQIGLCREVGRPVRYCLAPSQSPLLWSVELRVRRHGPRAGW